MPSEGQRSFYEILGVSPGASREEIDQACVDLWYRYHPMRTTQLWGDLSRHMEEIRCTLLNADARASYDKLLVGKQSTSPSSPQPKAQSGDQSQSAATSHIQEKRANNDLLQVPKSNFRIASYGIAVATAWLLNESIDRVSPQNWSDIATIAWLATCFGLAMTCLVWSLWHLFPMHGPTVAVKYCVDLWNRYHPMRTAQLWGYLCRQMKEIRSTLLSPDARASHDKPLVGKQCTSSSSPQPKAKSGDQSQPAATSHIQAKRANNGLLQVPKSKFRIASYGIAVATALLFSETIDWIRPENWSDIATIGWLVMCFGLATTCLVWSVFHLLPLQRPTLTAE